MRRLIVPMSHHLPVDWHPLGGTHVCVEQLSGCSNGEKPQLAPYRGIGL
jgi:hypothetical protein